MKKVALITKIYITLSVLFVVIALFAFSGLKESEVAGNLTFSMLILSFPSSLLSYPLVMSASDLFDAYDLYAYNSRLVLFVWWSIFFVLGVVQWIGFSWVIKSRKSNKSLKSETQQSDTS